LFTPIDLLVVALVAVVSAATTLSLASLVCSSQSLWGSSHELAISISL